MLSLSPQMFEAAGLLGQEREEERAREGETGGEGAREGRKGSSLQQSPAGNNGSSSSTTRTM